MLTFTLSFGKVADDLVVNPDEVLEQEADIPIGLETSCLHGPVYRACLEEPLVWLQER